MNVMSIYKKESENEGIDEWVKLREEYGIEEGEEDFEYGDVFKNEVNLEKKGGVYLKKGWLIGKEVV